MISFRRLALIGVAIVLVMGMTVYVAVSGFVDLVE